MTQQSYFWIYIPKSNACINLPKDIFKNVYSSFIHNNPQLETTPMSINKRMIKKLCYICIMDITQQ